MSPADGVTEQPPVLYEIWAAPPERSAPADAWVELYVDPDGPPLRLEASTISLLNSRVDAYTSSEAVSEAGVAVADGSLSMTLRQEWPLGASAVVFTITVALAVAVGSAVRSC